MSPETRGEVGDAGGFNRMLSAAATSGAGVKGGELAGRGGAEVEAQVVEPQYEAATDCPAPSADAH